MPLINTRDEDEEVKGDMTPMIDIIFLLLIFFILTTKFVPNEKAIANLMPTDKGQAATSPPVVEPPEDINIRIWPFGMPLTAGVQELDEQWEAMLENGTAGRQAIMQIGNTAPLLIKGANFEMGISAEIQISEVAKVQAYIREQLKLRSKEGGRSEQDPVVIHCFSGMPWKYAIVAYDAVRHYEAINAGGLTGANPQELLNAREVNFAPPRVRNYHTWERGNELWEIMNLK